MSNRLYIGFSLFEFIRTLFLRLAALVGLIYSLSHYNENPIVIIIIALLCFMCILLIGDDQIIVYQDKITQKTNSFSSFFFSSNEKTYQIRDIKSVYLQQPATSTSTETGVALALTYVLPKQKLNRNKSRPIFLELKDGKTIKLDTNLEMYKMKKIVALVNSLIPQKCA